MEPKARSLPWSGSKLSPRIRAIVAGSAFGQEVARMEINQARLGGTFDFDEMSSIDFGIQFTEVDNPSP